MSKEKLKSISKEILLIVFQIAFSRAEFGQVFPLGFAFAIARIFFGGNLIIVTSGYLVANIFNLFNFYLLLSSLFEIIILSLYYYFRQTIKTKKKILFLYLFLVLSTMLKLYLSITERIELKLYFIELVIKCIVLLYFLKLYSVVQKKFIFLKCSNFDYMLFSIFVVLFVLGIFRYEFLIRLLGLTIFVATILLVSRILPTDKYLMFSLTISMCFGYLFSSLKLVVLSFFVIILLVFISRIYKYLFLGIVLGLFFIICKLTNELTLSSIISLSSGVILTAFVPQKIINKLIDFFEETKLNVIKENLWHDKENDIRHNLTLMSKTLKFMRDEFKFLIVGKIDRTYASKELAKDIEQKCCETCENKNICSSSMIDKERLFSEYVYLGISKGGLSLDDLSIGVKTYCNKTLQLLNEINLRVSQYLEFETNVKTEDESKLLISTELENFANLFQNFEKNIEKSPKINKNLSKIAKEMLSNAMVDVVDIGVFESVNGIEKIDVVAENNVMMRKELLDNLSKIVRNKMQVKKIKHLDYSGLSLVNFVVANELKPEFAVSSFSKENVSGDNTLITKLDENRYFIAIADGMGHGKLAGKTSNMILELIKNLFIVGIDLELIIDSVNKLLLPVGLENFSTLDALIVDLRLKKCTFIKLGSSVSLIKHENRTEIINCESLPVGIVQNLKPTIIVKDIKEGDVIMLASDGVVDSFGEIENYKIFVNDQKINNLQRFTDNLIFELKMQPNKHQDDMSIIALKLLKNSLK